MKTYQTKSPAKINIGLRVLSKRKDGYHNIESIFYPVKIYDIITLKIEKTLKPAITVKVISKSSKLNLDDSNNICYSAVQRFLKYFRIKNIYIIKIIIKKNIPVGAGLGGGSSNAAAVLKLLAKHFKKSNDQKALNKISLKLGSDVPFFLKGKPAYAAGRGEKLTLLPKFKINYKILIVNKGIHVSTTWAYKQIKSKKVKVKKLDNIKSFKKKYKNDFVNDFEEEVFKKYPAIQKVKKEMYDRGAVFASMSGSGSSVYGFFKELK